MGITRIRARDLGTRLAALGIARVTRVTIFIMVFVLAIMALLIYKISLGRNWARITFLVLFVVGTLPYVPILADMFRSSVFVGLINLAQLGLQFFAIYLIFTNPGKTWFRAKMAT